MVVKKKNGTRGRNQKEKRMKTMLKTVLATGSLVLVGTLQSQATLLVEYTFPKSSGDEVSFQPDAQPTGGTASTMTRGSGLTATIAAGAFSSSGWTTANTRDVNDYYTFTVTPSANYQMTLTRLELDERRSGTGIREWAIYSSLDGYNVALTPTFAVPDDTLTRTDQGVNLGAPFSLLSAPISFRIYGYTSEGSGGTWRIDNVQLSGSLTAVPEASTWVAGLGLSLGMLGTFVRKHRK